MADDNPILKNLRPTPPPATATGDFADKPTPDEQRALDLMYDRTPEPLAPGEFYSTTGHLRTKLNQNFVRLGDAGLLNLDDQEKERKEYAALVRETNLPLGLAESLHDRWTSARLAQARPGNDASELAAQIDRDAEASRMAVRETWGARDAENLLQRAKKFSTQHPKLNLILNTGGIGSQPDVVQAIVSHVRDINFR